MCGVMLCGLLFRTIVLRLQTGAPRSTFRHPAPSTNDNISHASRILACLNHFSSGHVQGGGSNAAVLCACRLEKGTSQSGQRHTQSPDSILKEGRRMGVQALTDNCRSHDAAITAEVVVRDVGDGVVRLVVGIIIGMAVAARENT